MIVIHGGATFRPELRERVHAAANDLQANSRTEDGCVHYGLSWAVDDPDTICLIEVWRDADAHRAHTAMAHTVAFRDLAIEAAVAPPAFVRYRAEHDG